MKNDQRRGIVLGLAAASSLLIACGHEQTEPSLESPDGQSESTLTPSNIRVSNSPSRSSGTTLSGRTVGGSIYVFAASLGGGVTEVGFYVDDASMAKAPRNVERKSPYDLAGTGADGTARPLDTKLLLNGTHTVGIRVLRSGMKVEKQTVTFTVYNAPPKPNLVVKDISTEAGANGSVVFLATLANIGAAATPGGIKHGVSFWAGSTQLSWSDTHMASLAPGASVTVKANGGPKGTNGWVPTSASYTVEAFVDDIDRIDESNETDNKFSRTFMSAALACSDGVQNGTESAVDCGGGCGPCEWPFNPVPRATLRKSPKKVFAHWHYYPVAINNVDPRTDYYEKSWINPQGEGGKHAGYGGFMRERPIPRLPRPETDWLLRDMKQDVNLAKSIGIDGFFLNMWTDTDTNNGGLWTRAVTLVDAASSVGDFDIIPNFDMSIIDTLSDADAHTRLLKMLGMLKAKPSLYKLPDGRYVVGAFLAERRSAPFYQTLKQRAASELGMNIYLVPVFLGTGTTHFSTYAPISDAFAGWGTAIPTSTGKAAAVANLANAHGKMWIHPISSQDFRPYNYKFWEAKNTSTLRSHWETVIADEIDWVQIVTWNDHHEHHAIRPSTGKQWSSYDLSAYYIQWFKTGVQPTIQRDVLLYNHRVHASGTPYNTSLQTKPFSCVTGCPPVDEVELVAFLTAPGTVEITSGGKTTTLAAPAGRSVLKAPLAAGRPTFRLKRNGATHISFESAFDVRTTTTYQDLLYRGGSSARAAMSLAGSCESACLAGNAAKCELCPAEPMWRAR